MSLIRIEHLYFTYDGGSEPVFEDLDLQLDTDWKLGLVGRNGRGKTTLLRLLEGGLEYRGQIRTGGLACRRFPCAVRETEVPVSQVLRDISPEAEEWQRVRELSLLGLDEEVLERTFSTLSGGEQTRVLLSALFLDEGSWPMLDEPTDHLDEEGRELLAQYLSHSRRGFLLVSHDRAFLDRCVDHVLALNRTGPELVKGNFSVWYQEKQDRDRREQAQNQQLKGEIRRLEQAARRTSAWSDQVEKTKYASKNSGTAPRPGLCGPQVGQDDEEGQEPGEPAGVCHPGEGGSAPRRGAGRAPEAGPPGVPQCPPAGAGPHLHRLRRRACVRRGQLLPEPGGAAVPGGEEWERARPACSG